MAVEQFEDLEATVVGEVGVEGSAVEEAPEHLGGVLRRSFSSSVVRNSAASRSPGRARSVSAPSTASPVPSSRAWKRKRA